MAVMAHTTRTHPCTTHTRDAPHIQALGKGEGGKARGSADDSCLFSVS